MPRVEQIEVAWKIKVRGNTARLHAKNRRTDKSATEEQFTVVKHMV